MWIILINFLNVEYYLFFYLILEPSGQTIEVVEPVVNIHSDNSSIGIVNQVIAVPIDNTSLSSSNTDSSKKSTDNLLG